MGSHWVDRGVVSHWTEAWTVTGQVGGHTLRLVSQVSDVLDYVTVAGNLLPISQSLLHQTSQS